MVSLNFLQVAGVVLVGSVVALSVNPASSETGEDPCDIVVLSLE